MDNVYVYLEIQVERSFIFRMLLVIQLNIKDVFYGVFLRFIIQDGGVYFLEVRSVDCW